MMSPIAWAVQPLKRYADFSGRSSRAEYWWFVLLVWGALLVFGVLALAMAHGEDSAAAFGLILIPAGIAILGLLIPNLAVQVRRLHDQDRSGWMILLFFIPYIGG